VIELLVLDDNERPTGRLPDVRVQEKLPVAPIALITPTYGVLTVPTGSEVVEMASTGFTVMFRVAVTIVLATEVAVTVAVVEMEIPVGAT
jgi:hypothetical protein